MTPRNLPAHVCGALAVATGGARPARASGARGAARFPRVESGAPGWDARADAVRGEIDDGRAALGARDDRAALPALPGRSAVARTGRSGSRADCAVTLVTSYGRCTLQSLGHTWAGLVETESGGMEIAIRAAVVAVAMAAVTVTAIVAADFRRVLMVACVALLLGAVVGAQPRDRGRQ